MQAVDIIKKIAVIVINGGLIGYLVWLWLQDAVIVQAAYTQSNTFYFFVLLAVSVYVFINYSIKQFHIAWSRATLLFLGLLFLVVGHYVLANDGAIGIYVGDIVKIVGVVFIVAGPAKLFVSNKKLEEIKESQMEVIEV